MKIAVAAAFVATLASGAMVAPAWAQDDRGYDAGYACQQARHDSATAGTVLGALFGAALGSGIAGRGNHTGGAVIGALAGAAIGNGVGRGSARDSQACAYGDASDQSSYPYAGSGAYDQRSGYGEGWSRADSSDGYAGDAQADAWADDPAQDRNGYSEDRRAWTDDGYGDGGADW